MSEYDLGKQRGYDLARQRQSIPKQWGWELAKYQGCQARQFAKGVIHGYNLYLKRSLACY